MKGFVFLGVGFVETQVVPVGSLRTFCSHNGVGSKSQLVDGKLVMVRASKLTKKNAADAIAAKFPEYELSNARGQGDEFSRMPIAVSKIISIRSVS